LLEDIPVAPFIVLLFGTFVMVSFEGFFTTPAQQTFTLLAYGWVLAGM